MLSPFLCAIIAYHMVVGLFSETAKMDHAGPDEDAFWEYRRLGVGLDDDGNLVYAREQLTELSRGDMSPDFGAIASIAQVRQNLNLAH